MPDDGRTSDRALHTLHRGRDVHEPDVAGRHGARLRSSRRLARTGRRPRQRRAPRDAWRSLARSRPWGAPPAPTQRYAYASRWRGHSWCFPSSEVGRLEDLRSLVAEELNVKSVEVASGLEELVDYTLKPNFKTLGPRFGKQVGQIAGALAKADAHALVQTIESGGTAVLSVGDTDVELSADDLDIRVVGTEGLRAGPGRTPRGGPRPRPQRRARRRGGCKRCGAGGPGSAEVEWPRCRGPYRVMAGYRTAPTSHERFELMPTTSLRRSSPPRFTSNAPRTIAKLAVDSVSVPNGSLTAYLRAIT